MNQLNQIIRVLRVQIETEKKLLDHGKGDDERLSKLQEELKQCLQSLK